MNYVYVLISKKDRKLYVGMTQNLEKRLKQHTTGGVKSTVSRRPLTLIYYEVYADRLDAERREKYLKGGNGRAALKVQLLNVLKRMRYRYIST